MRSCADVDDVAQIFRGQMADGLPERQVWLIQRQLNDPVADHIGDDLVPDPLRFEQMGFRLIRGHAGKKRLEAVAVE
jgi:hypothetical protein